MRIRSGGVLSVLVVAWTAAPVQAQWVVTPYFGSNLAGDAEFRRGGPGASGGYVDDRLGFEFDVQRYNHFFKDMSSVDGRVAQGAAALGRVRRKDLAAAGIDRVPRMRGVRNGYPVLEDGRVLEVANVVWCTGFTLNHDWIDLSLPFHNGIPIHDRGIVESCPGLYFIGLLFLYSLSSSLVGGVGQDAGHIVHHIVSSNSGLSARS